SRSRWPRSWACSEFSSTKSRHSTKAGIMTHTHVNHAVVGSAPGIVNGAGMAAVLASGIGAFAVGLFVVLHETGLFVSPTLYAPAGGLSGRTTFAVIAWLGAWSV